MGFAIVTRNPAALRALGERQAGFLDALGARRVVIAANAAQAATTELIDLDGKFLPYMDVHDIETMVVRPDFYLYGAVSNAGDLNALVDDLQSDLQRHGLHETAARGNPVLEAIGSH